MAWREGKGRKTEVFRLTRGRKYILDERQYEAGNMKP